MKLINKITGFTLAAIAGFGLSACTNELNGPASSPNVAMTSPVASPDVIAWSGNQTFGNTFTGQTSVPGTRNSDLAYSAYDPQNTFTTSFEKPEGAVDITKSNFDQSGKVYYIPETFEGTLNLNWQFKFTEGMSLYNFGKVTDIINCNFEGVVNFYNNGELTWNISSGEKHNIHNNGQLVVLSYANIGNLYNFAELTLSYSKQYWDPGKAEIPDAMFIYSRGGSVTIPCDGDLKSKTEIHNTLVCDGNLNIQNDATDKYICGLDVDGNLNIDSDVTSSYIVAEDILLNGNSIFLTNGGHIIANKVAFEGNGITANDNEYEAIKLVSGTSALVEANSFYCKNDKLGNHLGTNVYANFETITYKVGGIAYTSNASEYVDELFESNRINNSNISGNPECGEAWGSTTPTDPTDPEDNCDKCGHPSHEPGDCPQCKEEENYEHPECNPKEETIPPTTDPTDPEECEHCHHPKHEPGNCETPGCNHPNCTPVPEDAKECPLCNHPVIWDSAKGAYVHWFNHTLPGGVCDECKTNNASESPCSDVDMNKAMRGTPAPGTGNTPNQGTNKYENNEVEINLSINEIHTLPNGSNKYDVADLVSKLSIHVRYPHDVEVILPVPEKFYCNQDDLYIFNAHYENKYSYGGDEKEISYNIGGKVVELHIEFVPANKENSTPDKLTVSGEGYIRVWTKGIDEDVIKYCREHYGDGINFEIYNYFNRGNQYTTGSYDSITLDDLQKDYLNKSYVIFDPEGTPSVLPDFYINAYNEVNKDAYGNGEIEKKDCSVWIIGDESLEDFYNPNTLNQNNQRGSFWDYYEGEHFNGSHFNWIYTNTSVKGSTDPNK